MTDLDRIEEKLDRLLAYFEGQPRSTSDLRRKAQADIIRLTARPGKRIKGHVRENDTQQ